MAANRPETAGTPKEHTDRDAARGLADNRALWDTLADFHGTDPDDRSYDVESFLAGRQTLRGIEKQLTGDVAGKDLLHLHCHFGMDTLSWARLGARVTGVDFSPRAITKARALAERAGLTAEFIEADAQRLLTACAPDSTWWSPRTESCPGSPVPPRGWLEPRRRCARAAAWFS